MRQNSRVSDACILAPRLKCENPPGRLIRSHKKVLAGDSAWRIVIHNFSEDERPISIFLGTPRKPQPSLRAFLDLSPPSSPNNVTPSSQPDVPDLSYVTRNFLSLSGLSTRTIYVRPDFQPRVRPAPHIQVKSSYYILPHISPNTMSEQVDLTTIPISPDGGNGPSAAKDNAADIKTVFHDKDNFNVKHPLANRWTLWFTKPASGKVRNLLTVELDGDQC